MFKPLAFPTQHASVVTVEGAEAWLQLAMHPSPSLRAQL